MDEINDNNNNNNNNINSMNLLKINNKKIISNTEEEIQFENEYETPIKIRFESIE